MGCETVRNRAHRVFAYAEMKIASGVAPAAPLGALRILTVLRRRIEVAKTLERRLRRGIEIGRAACQRRKIRRNRIHALPRRLARGDAFGVRWKHRNIFIPL